MYKFKHDRYKSARGGQSRLLDVRCEHCDSHLAYYQKDGPGPLKRMYTDRMVDHTPTGKELACATCARVLGLAMVYEKEQRAAYRLFAGAVTKRIVSSRSISL